MKQARRGPGRTGARRPSRKQRERGELRGKVRTGLLNCSRSFRPSMNLCRLLYSRGRRKCSQQRNVAAMVVLAGVVAAKAVLAEVVGIRVVQEAKPSAACSLCSHYPRCMQHTRILDRHHRNNHRRNSHSSPHCIQLFPYLANLSMPKAQGMPLDCPNGRAHGHCLAEKEKAPALPRQTSSAALVQH